MIRITLILLTLAFIKVIAQSDSVVTYYNNGEIKSVVHMRDNIRDGEVEFYWENGNIKEKLNFVNGRVEGLVRKYNTDGVLQEMFTIVDGKREGATSLFDSTGKYTKDLYYEEGILVVDKVVLDTGAEVEQNSKKNVTSNNSSSGNEQDDDSLPPVIEEEKDYSRDTTFFKIVEVMPEPYGGMEALYKKIGYPGEARDDEIQGTVKALVFIDRDGEVLDVKILEGIGHGCDEAVKTSILYHRFKPGLIRGQKVRVQMEMSFEFKLEKES